MALPVRPTAASAIPGLRTKVDWPTLVSRQDVEQAAPPPAPVHGLLLGNGDIGVTVSGGPECVTLQVGKNDIWDYRDPIDGVRPPITQQELVAWYSGSQDPAGSPLNRVAQELHSAYSTPMHAAKPAGQIRFRNPKLAGAAYSQRLCLWDAEVATQLGGPGPVSMRTLVPYSRTVIVAQYSPSGPQEFDVELARHADATGTIPTGPEFGAVGRDLWVRYRFPADATYPKGFEYVMYGRVLGGAMSSEVKPNAATVVQDVWLKGRVETPEGWAVAHMKASRLVTVIVAVVTTRDSRHPFAAAKQAVEDAQAAGAAALRKEHQQHWHAFWQRSFVQIEGNDFLTQHWFVSTYHLHCCSRPGKIAPGLYGNWTWQDASPWWSDYHWDYNFQQTFWGAYSSNHLEETKPYNQTVAALLPAAQAEAREVYGLAGAKFFLISYPRTTARNPYPALPLDRCMCLSAWAAQEMWWHYLYSQDTRYLRTRAYPVMRECARFYEGFLTRAADGRYDMVPTVSPEHWGLTHNFQRNKNSLIDLALIKYLMNACVSASEVLGADESSRATWRRIAAQLRGYPTTETPQGRVFVDVEGAPVTRYNVPVPVAGVFPGDDIGLHSPGETQEIARRTALAIPYNLTNDYVMLAMARVRLGIDVFDELARNTKTLSLGNGALFDAYQADRIWAENFAAPIVINESILQSYNGILRLAPVKLKQTVRFANLRAVGAFLVSGEIEAGGRVAYAAITSEAGKECSLYRPWQGDVRIRELSTMRSVRATGKDGVLSFRTRRGARYLVDDPAHPWEQAGPSASARCGRRASSPA
jgi:hypothetical protein